MKPAGFTLLELIITVCVIAILFGVAVPYYQDQWLKGRRAEAHEALVYHAQRLEQYYTAQDAYAGYTPTSASSDHYAVTINVSANDYTITATAQGDQAEDQENGVSCASLTWARDGTRSPAACWR